MIYKALVNGFEIQFFRFNKFNLWFTRQRKKRFSKWKPTNLTDDDFFVELGVFYFSKERIILKRTYFLPAGFKYLGDWHFLFPVDIFFDKFDSIKDDVHE
jgi:hypothetical protein